MDADEIKGALNRALPMRPPKWDADDDPPPLREKVERLENYLLDSAYMRAELEECLHWINAFVAHFAEQIKQITGYEVALPNKPRDRITQADINAAKRTVAPTSFELGAEMKQLRESISRQIDRFVFEEQYVVSRCYTMISGG